MNKLSFISSIPSDNDTTIYLVPTNSQKSLQFFNVELNMHFYDLSGNSRLTIPVNANDDGVYFKLSQLSSLGLGTYAFYLSMRYSDHMEYYPSNTAKYITLAYNNNRLVFKSIFTPEATNITPPDTSKIVERQVLHVHDIDIKDIKVSTIDSNKNANVYLDQYDVLHFDIPKGETGKSLYELARDAGFTGSFKDYEKTLVGPTGPKGDCGYNIWFDTHDYGENYRGSYWTDLKGSAPDRGPQVSDLVVLSSGHLVQVTGVNYGGVPEAGGGTFNYGPYLANLAGVAGPRGERGATGPQGPIGPAGKNFNIKKTFDSVSAMNASKGAGFTDGDFTMIASNVSDPDNSKLYVWDGSKFVYISDLSGAQGIQGEQGLTGPQGPKGDKGDVGKVDVNKSYDFTNQQFINGKQIVTKDELDVLADKLTQSMNTSKALGATVQNGLDALDQKIKQDGLSTQAEVDEFEKTLTKKVTDVMDQYSKKFDQGLATIADKANYNYDYQLDSDTNILFPAFTKQDQNSYRDDLYISDNGVDLYHVNQYGSNVDFTDHPVAVDCSTMFYDGYVYQIYDYVKSPYPDQINSHFLGGNGIQIRRSKDLINWEFIDVDLPTQWLQTWAPEWYVEDGNIYVVVSLSDCSASFKNETDGVVNWVKQTYIISTTDFKTWSDPQLINLGLDNCIDPFIIKENGSYYLFVKNEVTGKITEFKSDSLMTGYKQVCILDTNSNAVFEGPAVVEYKGGYLLIVDAPNEGLVAFYSTDIEKWGQTVHLSTNDGQVVKHCTPITLKDNKLREIVKNYVKVKGGLSPFAVSNQNTKKLSYIYPGQTKVSLFPNTLYVSQSNVTSEISITDYDTNLLRYGDTVEFALMSGNYGAKVLLAGNPNQQVWLPTTLELSAAKSNSNSIVTLECTNLGLVPQVYQPAPSFVYSHKTVDLKDTFAKTGGEYKPTADGYLSITVKTSGNQYLNILWADLGQSLFANTFQGAGYPAVTVPIRAQNTYRVEYNVDQIMSAKFFYTEASIQV